MGSAKSAMLILLVAMVITSCATAMDMSVVSYDHNNHLTTSPGRLHSGFDAEASLIFESWMVKHGKVYGSVAEKERRLTIFEDNLRFINNRNAENLSYRLGLTQFADLSLHEYGEVCHGADPRPPRNHVFMTSSDRYKTSAGDVLPKSVDWRNEGAVTEVKDQGHCRSCWAFSTVGAVEGLNKIVTGELVTLSEQDLINCNKQNNGCGGGKVETAYEFIMKNGGLGTDNDYPYKAVNGVCDGHLKENNKNVMIDGFENLPANDEFALMKAVAHQPVTAVIDSSSREFQLYESGVFDGSCGTNLNHGVVVVGYGTENGRDYWLVKNSRGNTWGEAGYMKMARNIANPRGLCGIAMRASYPLKNSFSTDKISVA
ncbi:Cathepsin propeptide inhibitor domain (I29) [Arabidopsis thaliana x Arabidopsis arenosa]|uniref:Cathepsin propeptide inhibitor domain (I29) n=1 Tax=Arabidopsis thaliana x Arabidopsis arenosa TaxID=1240361 RepID=A0A8T1Z3B9_9BRAS|nr:Cathepsin propeptide inhibitor domain (I29) [Arabidopsis thaliana x Arabidopsis arenosa]